MEDGYYYAAAAAAADGETEGYDYYEYDGSNVEGDGGYRAEEYCEGNGGLVYNMSTCPTSTRKARRRGGWAGFSTSPRGGEGYLRFAVDPWAR